MARRTALSSTSLRAPIRSWCTVEQLLHGRCGSPATHPPRPAASWPPRCQGRRSPGAADVGDDLGRGGRSRAARLGRRERRHLRMGAASTLTSQLRENNLIPCSLIAAGRSSVAKSILERRPSHGKCCRGRPAGRTPGPTALRSYPVLPVRRWCCRRTSREVRSPRRATVTTSRLNSGGNFFGIATSALRDLVPQNRCQPNLQQTRVNVWDFYPVSTDTLLQTMDGH